MNDPRVYTQLVASVESAPTDDGQIVELGAWLGASTAALLHARRAPGCKIHVYDRWRATQSEVEKAEYWGVDLSIDQDTLPVFLANLQSDPDLCLHRGDIRNATWSHRQWIAVLVVDAAKGHWQHIVNVFLPYLLDGASVCLLDFYYGRKVNRDDCNDQVRWRDNNPGFLRDEISWDGCSSAFFEWRNDG